MEKPSPEYFISLGKYARNNEDRDARDRYADRMTLRGITVLRDTDEENAPPVWRGDHSFSSDAASYSLTNFIEPEIIREHPQWTTEQIKKAAVERFEKRLEQDLSYEHKETSHEESIVYWQPIQTAGGDWELATAYGDTMITLSELWEHTRQYAEFIGNPAAYNPEEHKAQITMQSEFINGNAQGFVSVLSHPDAVRYVQVWQKAEDGSVVSKQVDLYKTTGRDFTHEEGEKFVEHLASFHNEQLGGTGPDAAAYAHFFIHEREVHEEDIRTIAIAQTMEYSESVFTEHISDRKTFPAIGNTVTRDISYSMVELGSFLREQIDRKISQFTSPKEKKRKKHEVKEDGFNPSVKSLPEAGSRVDVPVVRSERVGIAMNGVSSESMKAVAAEWWIVNSLLRHRESAAAAPAAILFLLTAPEEKIQHVVPESSQFRKKQAEVLPQTSFRIEKNKPLSIRTIMGLILGFNEKKAAMKATRIDLGEAENLAEIKREISKQRSNGEKITKVFPTVVMEKLLRMFRHFSRDVMRLQISGEKFSVGEAIAPVIVKDSVSEVTKEEERNIYAIARKLSIAVIVWWLIDFGKHNPVFPGEITKIARKKNMLREKKTPFENEPLWILFSIIWYLTALREQGNPHSVPVKKSKKKKGMQRIAFLPPSGIIFVYGS